MENPDKSDIERLAELVRSSIGTHRPKKNKVRAQSMYLRIFVIVCSALTTICLGLNFSENSPWIGWSRNFALVFAAFATAGATLIGSLDLDNYWLSRNVMITNLERISEKISFLTTTKRNFSQQEVEELFYEYQSTMNQHIDYWKGASTNSDKTSSIAEIPKVE